MRDAFINSINIQKTALNWMNAVSEDLNNVYTTGYRANQVSFKSYLDGIMMDNITRNPKQGKAIPGSADENVFIEGKGYFVLRNEEGRVAYTRYGDFKFDNEGVYRAPDGSIVQGYILNDKGEIMSGTKSLSSSVFEDLISEKGALAVPTTEIKLWKDPDNGKFLGKYDEFEIKEDGVLYGKFKEGDDKVPLYKLALLNFTNPNELFEFKKDQFLETAYSGKPILGQGEIKSGSVEASNVDLKQTISYWNAAQNQIDFSGQIVSAYKNQLQSMMELIN